MRNETYELNKTLIISASGSLEAWETWAKSLPDGELRAFHEQCIRLAKGIIKSWRFLLAKVK